MEAVVWLSGVIPLFVGCLVVGSIWEVQKVMCRQDRMWLWALLSLEHIETNGSHCVSPITAEMQAFVSVSAALKEMCGVHVELGYF